VGGRSRDISLIRRDLEITARIARGDRLADIADTYGITVARVSQINHAQRDSIPDDEKREQMAAKLEYVLDEKLLFLMTQPRQVRVSPSGKPVYELDANGRPDFSRPVLDDTVTIEAAKAVTSVIHEVSALYGLHIRKPKVVDETREMLEWQAYVADLINRNAELTRMLEGNPDIVDAEVVGED
jgi:transcriptional regulator with XRE-family HTH domain